MEDTTAQTDCFRNKTSKQPTSQQPDVWFAKVAQACDVGPDTYPEIV